MAETKTYLYDYGQYEEENKGAATMVEDILADPEFAGLTEVVIGSWGGPYEESCQPIIDGIIANKKRFSHIKKLFIGDMDFEECEVSWIIQGDYSKLWAALPNLKELTIKGSTDLGLGEIIHENLEALTIICGGLPVGNLEEIGKARLPKLKKLLLYIGSDNYGFDGNADTIHKLLAKAAEYVFVSTQELQTESQGGKRISKVSFKIYFLKTVKTFQK